MRPFYYAFILLLAFYFNANTQIIKSFNNGTTNLNEAGAAKIISSGYIVTSKFYTDSTQTNTINKYNLAGNIEWSIAELSNNISTIIDVAEFQNGDLLFLADGKTGIDYYTLIKTDASAHIIWSVELSKTLYESYENPVLKTNGINTIYVMSSTYNKTHVFKLNEFGILQWSKTLEIDNVTEKNPGFDFEIMADGGVLICGKAELDIFLVRMSATGVLQWIKRMNDNGLSYAHPKAITTLHDGNFLIAGFRGTTVFPYESGAFLLKIDGSGNILNNKFYRDTLNTYSFIPALVSEMPDYSIKVMGNGGPLTFVEYDENLNLINYSYWSHLSNCQTVTGGFDYKNEAFLVTCSDRFTNQYILRSTISSPQFCLMNSVETIIGIDLPIKNELYTNDIIITPGPTCVFNVGTLAYVNAYTNNIMCGVDEFVLETNNLSAASEINIYPNPISAGQELTIKLPAMAAFSYIIYGVLGELIYEGNCVDYENKITIPDIAKGTYFLSIKNDKTKLDKTQRLIVY